MKKILLLNLKTYKEATGVKALDIAKFCNSLAKKYKTQIVIAPQLMDLEKWKKFKNLKVIAQHIDPFQQGRNTGFVIPENLKKLGIYGTLLNHSEHKINHDTLKKSIRIAKKLNLKTFVCAKNVQELKKISRLKPNYICIEPPELIAGKISVSTAKPSLISNSTKATKIPVLAGAGVKSKEDVQKSYSLGAKGVLIASAFVKAKNKKKFLESILTS